MDIESAAKEANAHSFITQFSDVRALVLAVVLTAPWLNAMWWS
jgi:hypothetical protein